MLHDLKSRVQGYTLEVFTSSGRAGLLESKVLLARPVALLMPAAIYISLIRGSTSWVISPVISRCQVPWNFK